MDITDFIKRGQMASEVASSLLGKVLLVDDDSVSRRMLQSLLMRCDLEVIACSSVDEAVALTQAQPLSGFDCVVTDYRMPDKDGLWLLEWLQKADPHLAAIMVTAQGEKELVTATLRQGACDYLDKPVGLKPLSLATRKAVQLTRQRRSQARAELEVKAVGLVQQQMVGSSLPDCGLGVELCYHPSHEAGGDYFIAFPLRDETFLILATDVSGHDLRAAYLSAYFQGFVRGLVETNTPINVILERFNRYLVEESNRNNSSQSGSTQANSVSVAAVMLDRAASKLSSISCGFPMPLHSDGKGEARTLGDMWSSPLGWFPDSVDQPVEETVHPGSRLFLWTDGLEDVASALGVTPCSCAYDILSAKKRGATPVWMKQAGDDILVASTFLAGESSDGNEFLPVLYAKYTGAEYHNVDALQQLWANSLRLTIPSLSDEALFDVMLCLREVVINALKHGCQGAQEQTATLTLSVNSQQGLLRVVVSDPGPGYDFNWREHRERADIELIDEHRGLMLIDQMTKNWETRRKGAWVRMDFCIASALKEMAA